MATNQEIALQLEAALAQITGADIPSGTIRAERFTDPATGRVTHSFPEIAQMLVTGGSPTKGIPSIPGGSFSANQFWKALVKSGHFPGGLATYNRFLGMVGALSSNLSSGTTPSSSSAAQKAIASQRNLAARPVPGSAPETSADMIPGEGFDVPYPITIPGSINPLALLVGIFAPGGSALIAKQFGDMFGKLSSGEHDQYLEFAFHKDNPAVLEQFHREGIIDDKTLQLIGQGITSFSPGDLQPVDPSTGKPYTSIMLADPVGGWDGKGGGDFDPFASYDWAGRTGYAEDSEEHDARIDLSNIESFHGTLGEFLTYQKNQEDPSLLNNRLDPITRKIKRIWGEAKADNTNEFLGKGGYTDDGSYVTPYGESVGHGTKQNYADLIESDAEAAVKLGLTKAQGSEEEKQAILNQFYKNTEKGIFEIPALWEQTSQLGMFFGQTSVHPGYIRNAIAAYKQDKMLALAKEAASSEALAIPSGTGKLGPPGRDTLRRDKQDKLDAGPITILGKRESEDLLSLEQGLKLADQKRDLGRQESLTQGISDREVGLEQQKPDRHGDYPLKMKPYAGMTEKEVRELQERNDLIDQEIRSDRMGYYGGFQHTTGDDSGYDFSGPGQGKTLTVAGLHEDYFPDLEETTSEILSPEGDLIPTPSGADTFSAETLGEMGSSSFNPGGGWTDVGGGGEFAASGGPVGMQEGGMPMQMPQEGMEPPMPMPQQQEVGAGAEADMANLGMINEQAAPPQEGGQASIKDDVPREADEGDYILPYETVLLVGLKQLNRYAREAIKLAMKNDIDLGGTDLDPTDDVPIKVSNYEFHIPKILVPFFGGGKKYLDKIRDEGLALRKRLEEEKQPSMQQQQPEPAQTPLPLPQMEQAGPPSQMEQAGPPPMMQKGGFVPDPKQRMLPTTEAVLEGDVSQAQQSAYNQIQALERSRKQQQQPPMVDPTGKVTPQGFAAPQGYDAGGTIIDPDDEKYEHGLDRVKQQIGDIHTGQGQEFPVPGRKPPMQERDYFKKAKERMQLFNKLEPAKKLAMVAMLEGRGEGRQGMQAIMNVVMNRMKTNSAEFYDSSIQGTSLEQVLMKPLAFTALSALNKNHPYNNPKSSQYSPDKYSREVDNLANSFENIRTEDKNWKEAYEDAQKALAGQLDDITKGALFYYNPEKQDMPRHLKTRAFLTAVGKHHFYKSGGFVNKVLDTAA